LPVRPAGPGLGRGCRGAPARPAGRHRAVGGCTAGAAAARAAQRRCRAGDEQWRVWRPAWPAARGAQGTPMTAPTERIALFPLRTVLFPQGLLPLRIFETRYLDMIRRVMREGTGFGVVLILDGAEIGKVGEVAHVGTFARVVD